MLFMSMKGNVPVAVDVNSAVDFLYLCSFDVILEVTLNTKEDLSG